jgi:alpha-N-arabinofuranosidase
VPYLKLAAVHDPAAHRLTVFALNRSLNEGLRLQLQVREFPELQIAEAIQLHDPDLSAVNCAQAPDRVAPRKLEQIRVEGSSVEALLQPASWSVIRLRLLP